MQFEINFSTFGLCNIMKLVNGEQGCHQGRKLTFFAQKTQLLVKWRIVPTAFKCLFSQFKCINR